MTLPMIRLTGPRHAPPLSRLDPRTAAWRPDLADVALAGQVVVPHYVCPRPLAVMAAAAPLRLRPEASATMVSELLHGERFHVLDEAHGHAWGYGEHDRYVGHLPLEALVEPPTAKLDWQRIGPGDALVLTAADARAPARGVLPAGALVAVEPAEEGFVRLVWGRWAGGLVASGRLDSGPVHPVAAALTYLGAPYRWGGRRRAGIDCSGLVQTAFAAAGVALGRDSDMQAADAERLAAPADDQPARPGDLLWWPGHVGLMVDQQHLIHAHQHGMTVSIEPLARLVDRLRARGAQATPRRWRFPGLGVVEPPGYGTGAERALEGARD